MKKADIDKHHVAFSRARTAQEQLEKARELLIGARYYHGKYIGLRYLDEAITILTGLIKP